MYYLKACLTCLLFSCLPGLSGLTAQTASPEQTTYFSSTLETPDGPHLPNPDAGAYRRYIPVADLPRYRTQLWAAWKQANAGRLSTWPRINDNSRIDSVVWSLPTDKKVLFALYKKGHRPSGGYPLFINLHGGGTNPQSAGPWTDAVNSHEWAAAKYLGMAYADTPSLYFIPRMADDRRGRWYHKGEQAEFLRAWQLGVLSGDVDPDKTYLLGISEGGYGSFRMGPFFADYFAGAGPMAGVSYNYEAPVENLRNTPFRITVGEFDYAYGRSVGAAQWKAQLDSASAANPGQFVHVVDIEKGRGHGVDYYQTAPWLRQFVRNPYPDTLGFQYYAVHDTVFGEQSDTSYTYRKGFGYIRLDGLTASAELQPDGLLKTGVRDFYIEKQGNTYHIRSSERTGRVTGTIGLSLDKVDFDQPVSVFFNGRLVYKHKVRPSEGVMLESLALFGDPGRIFAARIDVRVS